jgi:hypothetical protein
MLQDWSGSTSGKRTLLEKAATRFLDRLRSQDWVAFGRFSGHLQMEPWLSAHLQSLQTAPFKTPIAEDNTHLYASLEQALTTELLPFVGRRRAIVLLTDGIDNGLETALMSKDPNAAKRDNDRFDRLIEIVRQERVPIYIVAVDSSDTVAPQRINDFARVAAAAYPRLDRIAHTSGGSVLRADKLENVLPLFLQISQALGSTYTLGYYSSEGLSPGTRRITVKTSQRGLTVVQSRSSYQVP